MRRRVSRNDADYILDTFPVVKKNDEKAYGEFRTKRLVLDRYDAMAEAIATGTSYRTALDRGAVQSRLLSELTEGRVSSLEDVDFERAEREILARLTPVG